MPKINAIIIELLLLFLSITFVAEFFIAKFNRNSSNYYHDMRSNEVSSNEVSSNNSIAKEKSDIEDDLIEVIRVGKIKYGTLDSWLKNNEDDGFSFLSDSDIGSVIFATCKDDELCRIKGIISKTNSYPVLKKVLSVEKIDYAIRCNASSDCPTGDVCRSVKGGGTDCFPKYSERNIIDTLTEASESHHTRGEYSSNDKSTQYNNTLDSERIDVKTTKDPINNSVSDHNFPIAVKPSENLQIAETPQALAVVPQSDLPPHLDQKISSVATDYEKLIYQLLDYAPIINSTSQDLSIQNILSSLKSFPHPSRGDRKLASQKNDEALRFFRSGDLVKAEIYFNDAFKIDASYVEAIGNLGFLQLKLNKLDEAVTTLTKVLVYSPTRVVSWMNLGDVFALQGDFDRSVAAYSLSYYFSSNKIKLHTGMVKMNNEENVDNVKRARSHVILWALNTYPVLNTNQ